MFTEKQNYEKHIFHMTRCGKFSLQLAVANNWDIDLNIYSTLYKLIKYLKIKYKSLIALSIYIFIAFKNNVNSVVKNKFATYFKHIVIKNANKYLLDKE